MSAYLIARVRIQDLEIYKDYALLSKPSIEAFDGRFLARGGDVEILEGESDFDRMVVVEFKDMDTARSWYNSDLYKKARDVRNPISQAVFTLVDGI